MKYCLFINLLITLVGVILSFIIDSPDLSKIHSSSSNNQTHILYVLNQENI